ncbi:MAG: MBL fold metallo-hydrolase [Pseudomonadota bacterium]
MSGNASGAPVADVLVTGSSVKLADDFIGISTVALIIVGRRRILVDAGGPATRGSMLKALAERGIAPAEIDTVLLTHLHFDHCWNIDLFPDAQLAVSRRELAYAAAPHPDDAFVPNAILERLARRRVTVLDDAPTMLAPGVEAVPAPGHTPGLVAVTLDGALVDGEGRYRGRVVLASDAIKTPRELASRRADLEFDPQARAGATMAQLTEGADVLVPGHAPTLIRGTGGWTWEKTVALPLVIR